MVGVLPPQILGAVYDKLLDAPEVRSRPAVPMSIYVQQEDGSITKRNVRYINGDWSTAAQPEQSEFTAAELRERNIKPITEKQFENFAQTGGLPARPEAPKPSDDLDDYTRHSQEYTARLEVFTKLQALILQATSVAPGMQETLEAMRQNANADLAARPWEQSQKNMEEAILRHQKFAASRPKNYGFDVNDPVARDRAINGKLDADSEERIADAKEDKRSASGGGIMAGLAERMRRFIARDKGNEAELAAIYEQGAQQRADAEIAVGKIMNNTYQGSLGSALDSAAVSSQNPPDNVYAGGLVTKQGNMVRAAQIPGLVPVDFDSASGTFTFAASKMTLNGQKIDALNPANEGKLEAAGFERIPGTNYLTLQNENFKGATLDPEQAATFARNERFNGSVESRIARAQGGSLQKSVTAEMAAMEKARKQADEKPAVARLEVKDVETRPEVANVVAGKGPLGRTAEIT